MLKWAMRIVRDAALVYMGLVLWMALSQRGYIYYPHRVAWPDILGIARDQGAQVWNLRGDRDYDGWLFPIDSARTNGADVWIFHGNAGHALHRVYFVQCLRELPLDGLRAVYVFEYPGYGAKKGKPSEAEIAAAASRALGEWIAANPERDLYILGESLGSGVACYLAGQYPERIKGLFLATPFSSLADVAQHHYPYLPVRWFLRERYDNVRAIRHYSGRVYVLAAAEDKVVPAKFAEKLFRSYDGPKKLCVLPETDHNSLLYVGDADWWVEGWRFLMEVDNTAPRA